MENETEARVGDGADHDERSQAVAPAVAVERIAVVTTLYSEVRRLPRAEAEALIEAGDARRATEVDLAIGG